MFFLAADPVEHVTDKYIWAPGGVPILTMHMVTIILVTGLFVFVMTRVARAIQTGPEADGNERYITKGRVAQAIEVMITYLRDEMLIPVLGEKHTRRYLPYLMTLFFFILFNNLFGLIPIMDILHLFHVSTFVGGTATGNIMITGALAFLSFLLIEIHGFRELGVKGWLEHQTGGLINEPWYIWPVMIVVVPVELLGHLIKPTALAIRLFANMFAGHTLVAVLLSFGAIAVDGAQGFTVTSTGITLVSALAAIAIMFLELFVAFLQAFIFMFLTAVFVSLMSHHDEHHEDEHGDAHPEPAAVPA